jgi:hypothetical protein
MSKPSSSDLTPFPPRVVPAVGGSRRVELGVLAYRLRCLSDDLTWLAHAVPEAEGQTVSELLQARDTIWFAARRLQSSTPHPHGTHR